MQERNASIRAIAGNDLPVTTPDEDRYGYVALAENLCRSIIALDDNVSTVIGIEGPWGSGKTSLLNLLLCNLRKNIPAGTHVLHISPWLNHGGVSSVESLLVPVAAILDEEMARTERGFRRVMRKVKGSNASVLATDVLRYAQQASGRLAPLAELAGNFIPGAGIVSSSMKTLSAADLSASSRTADELRSDIEKKIASLGLSFIVVLDDLDRLDPGQAVEVLRLVRSVADFSRFRYVMCYDPLVLGDAVERGLGVANGQHYLQKIVQLSFPLPRPESFVLRHEFLTGAVKIYMDVTGKEPDKTILTDLKEVAGTFGATLGTPREVRLALSAIGFRYPPLHDFIWFPDLCLLQLLRVTTPALYNWTEHYLTEHAVVESGEGQVSGKEVENMSQTLTGILRSLPAVSPLSVMTLSRWLPGIAGIRDDKPLLFGKTPDLEERQLSSSRRLRSRDWWRHYFAFAPPRNILLPDFFEAAFALAGSCHEPFQLAEMLLAQVTDNGFSSRTRFEQFLDKLTPYRLADVTPSQCRGLIWFFFEYADELVSHYHERSNWFAVYDLGLDDKLDALLTRLLIDGRDSLMEYLTQRLKNGKALYWTAIYLRHLVWQNGMAGDRPDPEERRVFSDEEVRHICNIFSTRLKDQRAREQIAQFEDLAGFLYAWRDISASADISTWMTSVTHNDESFLQILLQLRHRGISSATGHYRALRLKDIAEFFEDEQAIRHRLDEIEGKGNFQSQVQEIRDAISLSR